MDDDLVEESILQALPGDVRAEDDNVAVAGRLLGDGHRLLDADVQETPVTPLTTGGSGGGSCRSTKNGPRNAPP